LEGIVNSTHSKKLKDAAVISPEGVIMHEEAYHVMYPLHSGVLNRLAKMLGKEEAHYLE
jgi:hypothetical protein